jgi:hypothetical protein
LQSACKPGAETGDYEYQPCLCVSGSESNFDVYLDLKLAGCGTNNWDARTSIACMVRKTEERFCRVLKKVVQQGCNE